MAFPDNLVEGILVSPSNQSRGSPFARNKGFSERYDRSFEQNGQETLSQNGVVMLWDVRAFYGFFLWLLNNSGGLINAELFFSYRNFDNVTDLDGVNDWVPALDSAGSEFFNGVANNDDEEAEVVRITSRITAVRLDISSATPVTLRGTFSAV